MALPIACVYTVENYVTLEKPIKDGNSIPFGIAMIASVLKRAGHKVEVLVFTPDTPILETLRPFVERFRPRLFCLTAVSSQFPLVSSIAAAVKQLDPAIFVALGGAHASLRPEEAIACPAIDAICVGEGDTAVVELAAQIQAGRRPAGIHNFWFKVSGGEALRETPRRLSGAILIACRLSIGSSGGPGPMNRKGRRRCWWGAAVLFAAPIVPTTSCGNWPAALTSVFVRLTILWLRSKK